MHPSATGSALERARHAAFIGQSLAMSFAALAVAPFFLAFHGAPTLAESLVFACALAHVAAAMLVARTGRLVAGHFVGYCGLLGISLMLFLGIHAGVGCALAWLVVAQLEAMASFDRALARWCGLVTGAAFLGILAVALAHPLATTVSSAAATIIAGLAFLAAACVGHRLVALVALIRDSEREQGERSRAVAEALGDAIVGFDAGGSVIDVSPRCETFLGAAARELMGRGLFDHVHVADRPAFLKLVADAAHGGETLSASFRLRLWQVEADATGFAGPAHLWIEMRVRGIAAGAGAPGGEALEVVAVLRDITALHQHELEIEAARQSTEEAIRAKDHFLANMSHELRTPLNAIIGFSEMLANRNLRPVDADKQREYARIINQSGEHLLSVVNSILDMSKIQSGTFTIIPEPFDVSPLIDQCCDMVTLKAEAGRIRLERDYAPALGQIVGDKRAYKQILINLLSNAVKFTPEQGRVTIRARPEGNSLIVSVMDTGIGIAAADLTRLGDPFFQARSSLCRPYEGTGLGLSVVRGLLGLHGGDIAIESEIDNGTNVTIRLPLDCRVIDRKPGATAIETIARRVAPEAVPSDRRMRKIA